MCVYTQTHSHILEWCVLCVKWIQSKVMERGFYLYLLCIELSASLSSDFTRAHWHTNTFYVCWLHCCSTHHTIWFFFDSVVHRNTRHTTSVMNGWRWVWVLFSNREYIVFAHTPNPNLVRLVMEQQSAKSHNFKAKAHWFVIEFRTLALLVVIFFLDQFTCCFVLYKCFRNGKSFNTRQKSHTIVDH